MPATGSHKQPVEVVQQFQRGSTFLNDASALGPHNATLNGTLIEGAEQSIEVRLEIHHVQKIVAHLAKSKRFTRFKEILAGGTKFKVPPVLLGQSGLRLANQRSHLL